MVLDYKKITVIIAIVAGISILYFLNPENTIWMPKCPFYLLTGYQCPGCGIQRAVHQLLHLNLHKAFEYNMFVFILAPYILSLIIVTWFDPKEKLKKLKNICYSSTTIYIYLVLMVVWWIIRNIID